MNESLPMHDTPPDIEPEHLLDRSRFPIDPWALVESRYSDTDLEELL